MASTKPVLLDHRGQALKMMDTAHKGASKTSRELASWNPQLLPPDREINPELSTLVARQRDLRRNNGVASGIVQTHHDNIVGTGFRLSAKPDFRALKKDAKWARAWATDVESRWRAFAESFDCDAARQRNFHGLTSQVFDYGFMSGEALALVLWRPERRNRTVLQIVDPDRLGNPMGSSDQEGRSGGIEYNRLGEAVAYWIRRAHPGLMTLGAPQWMRIPAQTRFGRRRVLHVADRTRAQQSRAVPALTSVLSQFKLADHYSMNELKAAVINAMIAAFIETPLDGEAIAALFGEKPDKYLEERAGWDVALQGGSIIPLFPGDKLNAFTPNRPNDVFGAFMETVHRHIGAGANLPYELLLKDFSKTNYSSARAALLEAWRFFNGRRRWLATYWATPVYELWLEEQVNKEAIEAPDFAEMRAAYTRCRWIGPGRGWIDPVKEGQAAQIRMDVGISTLENECAEQGLDWQEVLEQRRFEKDFMAELGLEPADLSTVLSVKPRTDEDSPSEPEDKPPAAPPSAATPEQLDLPGVTA